MAKPIKSLESHYAMIQFLINMLYVYMYIHLHEKMENLMMYTV